MSTKTLQPLRDQWRTEWAKSWTWMHARAGHRPPAHLNRKQRRANWKQEWHDEALQKVTK